VAAAVEHPGAEIEIICGYRTAWSNEFLRARSAGVAKNSQPMQAHAIDIRIPGVDTPTLRNAALALGRWRYPLGIRSCRQWDASVRGVRLLLDAPTQNSLCKWSN
jgi:hypothetical protein